jgi:biotin transport system substrate-specific component
VPSSGYLIGWPLGAAVTGLVMSLLPMGSPRRIAASAFLASAVGGLMTVHAFGVMGLVAIAGLTWTQALLGTLAFVPGDLIKCALCALVVHAVARGMPEWRFGRRAIE